MKEKTHQEGSASAAQLPIPNGWRFDKPLLTVFCNDPGAEGAEKPFQERVPGAKGLPHVMLEGPGHFACDEIPDEFSALLLEFIRTTGAGTA
jgi:haloalkane dehalogenase